MRTYAIAVIGVITIGLFFFAGIRNNPGTNLSALADEYDNKRCKFIARQAYDCSLDRTSKDCTDATNAIYDLIDYDGVYYVDLCLYQKGKQQRVRESILVDDLEY